MPAPADGAWCDQESNGLKRERPGLQSEAGPFAHLDRNDAAAVAGRIGQDVQHLMRLCAFHLAHTTPDDERADPVARFHLHNGARLERIDWAADTSPKGVGQSLGLMVNYLYDLDEIEANHQKFVGGQVSTSRAVTALL